METRLLGKTGHRSTLAIFGAAALGEVTVPQAKAAFQQVMQAGVNHIDVAPSYGKAEELLGPLLPPVRQRFFLGCKTTERSRAGAAAELRRSLEKLQTDHFDLYQLHAITSFAELDQVTIKGGALEAALEARRQGLTRSIGITGHGMDSPAVFSEALDRFDFDTVLFPVNFVLYANPDYRIKSQALLEKCRQRNVGVMAIKAVAERPWGEGPKTADTWYRPFEDPQIIQSAINFALSQDVTGLCTSGDVRILPLFLKACEDYKPLTPAEQQELIETSGQYEVIF